MKKTKQVKVHFLSLKKGDVIVRYPDHFPNHLIVEREVETELVDGLTACKAYREGKQITRYDSLDVIFSKQSFPVYLPNFLLDNWIILEDE